MSTQPELSAPPEFFYNDVQVKKYTHSSRIINVQEQMCDRAIELLFLPEKEKCFLLDVGCGSGLSGNVIDNKGYVWIGIDISPSMLKVATDREVKGDLILSDMGQGIPFKAGIFDGAISISALQWLCNIDNSKQFLHRRLQIFFGTLFAALSCNARAVFQFYPQNDAQVNVITEAAAKAGFFGGVVVDYPNSKRAKKLFLVLMTSSSPNLENPIGIYKKDKSKNQFKRKYNKVETHMFLKSRKNWILKKKERFRQQGKYIKTDSKYTGRSRRKHF